MAKLSKEDLLTRVNESGMTDDEKISFMEDITDSFIEPDTTELDKVKADYEDLKEKYKARFLSSEEVKDIKEEKEQPKEMEEKEVIDIKDIFKKKEDED